MGNEPSKPFEASGPIVGEMCQKYGPDCLRCRLYWSKSFGFPPNGSLSLVKLRMLKHALEEEERKQKGKKTIKTEILEQIEDNKACFNVWMKEADNRERKQLQKQTTC